MITELYYGRINRSEFDCDDNRCKALGQRFLELHDILQRQLTPEQFALFNEMIDIQSERSEIACADRYKTGFRDGVKMIIDVLTDADI